MVTVEYDQPNAKTRLSETKLELEEARGIVSSIGIKRNCAFYGLLNLRTGGTEKSWQHFGMQLRDVNYT
jgi:hypothetical protein